MTKYFTLLIVASTLLFACSGEVDTEKPSIDLTAADAFPKSCETLYFDEPFTVKWLLTDNVELGSYNIDIHHNFDQHNHSTEFEKCDLDDVKTAVNPYTFIQDYSIPEGSSDYNTEVSLTLPASDGTNLYDEGDYHFQLKVTDQEGWSKMVGLSVKILHK